MLRLVIFALGCVGLCLGALILLLGGPVSPGISLLVLGLILALGIAYERVRYKAHAPRAPGPGWQKTEERFIDPETGRPVTVYFRPTDGERMYVEE